MNFGWLGLTAAGAAILGGSVLGALGPAIPAREARVFHAINGLPGWLYWPLWPPMQLGNLVVGTVVGLLVAWVVGDLAMAIGVVVAMVLKLVIERVVRKKMAEHLQIRQRPGTSEVGAVLRGADVPSSGPSFPSGHIILVAAISCVVIPAMPAMWSVGARSAHVAGDARAGVRRGTQPARRHGRARSRSPGRRRAGPVRSVNGQVLVDGGRGLTRVLPSAPSGATAAGSSN